MGGIVGACGACARSLLAACGRAMCARQIAGATSLSRHGGQLVKAWCTSAGRPHALMRGRRGRRAGAGGAAERVRGPPAQAAGAAGAAVRGAGAAGGREPLLALLPVAARRRAARRCVPRRRQSAWLLGAGPRRRQRRRPRSRGRGPTSKNTRAAISSAAAPRAALACCGVCQSPRDSGALPRGPRRGSRRTCSGAACVVSRRWVAGSWPPCAAPRLAGRAQLRSPQ